jgi:hypothetical protein
MKRCFFRNSDILSHLLCRRYHSVSQSSENPQLHRPGQRRAWPVLLRFPCTVAPLLGRRDRTRTISAAPFLPFPALAASKPQPTLLWLRASLGCFWSRPSLGWHRPSGGIRGSVMIMRNVWADRSAVGEDSMERDRKRSGLCIYPDRSYRVL